MSMPTGGFVAISVTPLDEDGAVDYEDLTRLMQFYPGLLGRLEAATGVAITEIRSA